MCPQTGNVMLLSLHEPLVQALISCPSLGQMTIELCTAGSQVSMQYSHSQREPVCQHLWQLLCSAQHVCLLPSFREERSTLLYWLVLHILSQLLQAGYKWCVCLQASVVLADYNHLLSLQQVVNITLEKHSLVFILGLITLQVAKMFIETVRI